MGYLNYNVHKICIQKYLLKPQYIKYSFSFHVFMLVNENLETQTALHTLQVKNCNDACSAARKFNIGSVKDIELSLILL